MTKYTPNTLRIDKALRTVVAYANTRGGEVTVKNELLPELKDALKRIRPDITPLLSYYPAETGETVISLTRGDRLPYSLNEDGRSRVWIAVEYGIAPADSRTLGELFAKENLPYEATRLATEDLSFSDASWEFDMRNIPFDPTASTFMRDGFYTGLAYLISDQCAHTVKVAVFDKDNTAPTRSHSFSGSLLRQVNDAASFISMCARAQSEEEEALLKECLVNALIHRDYRVDAPILVSIYQGRMEFTSPGGLPAPLTAEDAILGVSVCRNPALASLFASLGLSLLQGIGLKRLTQGVSALSAKLDATANAVRVTLMTAPVEKTKNALYTSEEEIVLAMALENNGVTRQDLEKRFGTSPSTASRLLRRLEESGMLIKIGSARSTKYVRSSR